MRPFETREKLKTKSICLPSFRNGYLRLWLLFVALVSALHTDAAWNSFVVNFNKKDYDGGTSTWRIVTYGRWTFFANQKGVLQFDGTSWKSYPLNNRGEARGVAIFPNQNRLYVGGENEYGYFEPMSSGALKYHCISEELGKEYSQVGNIFDFYEYNGTLYMRGDKYIIVKTDGKYTKVTSQYNIFASLMKDGVLYVATDHGVMMLAGSKLVPIHGGDVLSGMRINAMVEYADGIIVTTSYNGLFFYDGITMRPYLSQMSQYLSKATVCCAAMHGNKLALGTIHGGLIVVDVSTGQIDRYDESRGLQNNTVISVAFDNNGNVWAGLDYGIDYIQLECPFTYLYRSPDSYGIGFTSMLYDNKLYLGTDRGLYYADNPVKFSNGRAEIHSTEVPSGLTWCLHRVGDELLCLHDKGIFCISGGRLKRVTDIIGAWSCQSVLNHPDMMFVGTYNGMYLIKKSGDTWTNAGKIKGIDDRVRYFRQQKNNIIKVYYPNNGTAVTYVLDKSLVRAVSKKVSDEQYVAKDTSDYVKYIGGGENEMSENILRINSTEEIVPCEQGFLMLNRDKLNKKKHEVFIQSMRITGAGDSVVYSANFCGIKPEPEIDYKFNSVRFEYSVPYDMLSTKVTYCYRVNGGEWSAPSKRTVKELTNMSEGKYTFEVMATFYDNTTATDSITFRILPPWYRTWLAYLIYIILFSLLVLLGKRLIDKRLERKEKEAFREKNREISQMKTELDHLEKEKMDMDLKHKSQEIANLVINVARKNEILSEIKEDIKNVIISSNGIADIRRKLLIINNKVDTSIEVDDVLHRFENEFDLVHNNFTKKLREAYPGLSANEYMLCVYLKMDLSTKDIAPLLNISVRGVETMRYRVRKKLQLSREDSLTEFLNSFA